MATEIRVPTLGESVTEATIGKWLKAEGDAVAVDEPLVELETDKVSVEVPAPAAGKLSAISVKEGETVEVGALLGMLEEGAAGAAAAPAAAAPAQPAPAEPAAAKDGGMPPSPAASRLAAESGVDTAGVAGSDVG